jgi:hypothetical protein
MRHTDEEIEAAEREIWKNSPDYTIQDLFDIAQRCLKCKADLTKVVTCGMCHRGRERAFPENHKFDLNKQMRKIDDDMA